MFIFLWFIIAILIGVSVYLFMKLKKLTRQVSHDYEICRIWRMKLYDFLENERDDASIIISSDNGILWLDIGKTLLNSNFELDALGAHEDLFFPPRIYSKSHRSLKKRGNILLAIEKASKKRGKGKDPSWQKLLNRAQKEIADAKKETENI